MTATKQTLFLVDIGKSTPINLKSEAKIKRKQPK